MYILNFINYKKKLIWKKIIHISNGLLIGIKSYINLTSPSNKIPHCYKVLLQSKTSSFTNLSLQIYIYETAPY